MTIDKGYDWQLLRRRLRAENVKPLIKHHEKGLSGVANNALIDDTTYLVRSNVEAAFFALRGRYRETLHARTWFGQFRELVLKGAVRNIELAVRDSHL